MSRQYLFDTTAGAALIRGNPDLAQLLRSSDATYIPVIALGELYYGAEYSRNPLRNIAHADEFAAGSELVAVDAAMARHYGSLAGDLRRRGRMIPDNDNWIAALAIQHGLTLLTQDKHFAVVPGLMIQGW